MSEEIKTLVEGVVINSMASDGKYYLDVESIKDTKEASYSYSEYPALIRRIWDNYFSNGNQPELLGFPISLSEFIGETRHAIAPSSFSISEEPLNNQNESLFYFLLHKKENLNIKSLGRDDLSTLNWNLENLEYLAYSHIRKKLKIKDKSQ